MAKGQCPVCKRIFKQTEWEQMPCHTEYTYVDCIPQIEGDVTKCPGCGEYVIDDSIKWVE